MTSSTTTIKAVSDGTGTVKRPAPRRQDLSALRDHEAKTLIALVCEANRTTSAVAHDMFDAIYDRDSNQSSAAQLQDRLCEALTCLETTDHYLRMLGSVLDERADIEHQDQDDSDPEDPGEPPF
jgi:hypothetical protein